MERFPFTCLVARGSHSHHPPQPSRLPIHIANDFIASLKQSENCIASMTPRKFSICSTYAVHILNLRQDAFVLLLNTNGFLISIMQYL